MMKLHLTPLTSQPASLNPATRANSQAVSRHTAVALIGLLKRTAAAADAHVAKLQADAAAADEARSMQRQIDALSQHVQQLSQSVQTPQRADAPMLHGNALFGAQSGGGNRPANACHRPWCGACD